MIYSTKNFYVSLIFIFITLNNTFKIIADNQEVDLTQTMDNAEDNDISYLDFNAWQSACDKLTKFDKASLNPFDTALTKDLINQELDKFFLTMQDQFNKTKWINDDQLDIGNDKSFNAYNQKIVLPNNSAIAIHGDLHGDIQAINKFIETFKSKGFLDNDNAFKIKDPNFYILFLGDYVDRGWYGSEVIYTILRLKNENPDKVFLVRGNHEDINLNQKYGFIQELILKFNSEDLIKKINKFYDHLPLAIYLGSIDFKNKFNFIQCCHGGIELGFDPHKLLENDFDNAYIKITELMQKDGFSKLESLKLFEFEKYFKNNKKIDNLNGFMWSDFIVKRGSTLNLSHRDGYSGQIFEFGELSTQILLNAWSGNNYKLRSIFRGHQQGSKSMRNRILNLDNLSHVDDTGIGKLWIKNTIHKYMPGLLNNIATVTFSVVPQAGYDWPIYSFAELIMANKYKDWRLNAINLEMQIS